MKSHFARKCWNNSNPSPSKKFPQEWVMCFKICLEICEILKRASSHKMRPHSSQFEVSYYHNICLEGLRKTRRGFRNEIWTRDLINTKYGQKLLNRDVKPINDPWRSTKFVMSKHTFQHLCAAHRRQYLEEYFASIFRVDMITVF
jgi:hypothetical protein